MGNEELLEEMLADAKNVHVPSSLDNQVVHTGDEEMEAPMIVKELSSAGWVEIWDTETYEKSFCLRYMLPSKLAHKRRNGQRIFTARDPGIKPSRGEWKCYLHPDNPEREHYNTLGLPVCLKANLRNKFQVERHMAHRHKQEWETIKDERERAEKEEDRKFQRELYASVTKKSEEPKVEEPTEKAPLYVSDKDKKK